MKRRFAALALALAVTVTALIGAVPLTALFTVLLLAVTLVPAVGRSDGTSVLWWTPVAVPFLVVGWGVPAAFAGLAGVSLWDSPFEAAWMWLPPVWVAAGLAWMRGGRVRLWDGTSLLAGVLPAVLLGMLWVRSWEPFESGIVRFLNGGTDPNNNFTLVYKLLETNVAYSVFGSGAGANSHGVYPRGMHSVAAWLSAMGGETSTVSDLVQRATTAMVGGQFAVFTATVFAFGLLAGQVARMLRLPVWVAGAVTVVAGAVLLNQNWFTVIILSGSWAASGTLLMLAVGLMVVTRPVWLGSGVGVLVAFALVVVVANVWQLALPVFGAFAVLQAVLWWRQGRVPGSVWSRVGVTVAGAVAVAVAAFPPMGTLFNALGGADQAAVRGSFGVIETSEIVAWLTVFAVTATVSVIGAWRARSKARWVWLLWIGLVAGLVAFAVVLNVQVASEVWPMQYYPARLLWLAFSLAVPVAVAGVAAAVVWVFRSRPARMLDRLPGGRPLVFGGAGFLVLVAWVGYVTGQESEWVKYGYAGQDVASAQIAVLMNPQVQGLTDGEVLVWGLYRTGPTDTRDGIAMSTLTVLGHENSNLGLLAARTHVVGLACEWLKVNPTRPVITGPDVQFSVNELLKAGCPEDVIRAERWVPVTIPLAWFVGTEEEGVGFVPKEFPTLLKAPESVESGPVSWS